LPLLDAAKKQGCCVVVDEAYGEYTDQDDRVVSCARYAGEYPNLMVLRTFSKIYGLPSIRVGYLICSSADIRTGLQVYCPYFPVTWFSLYLAQMAFVDQDYVNDSRRINRMRRDTLQEGFRGMSVFRCLSSDTNTLMVRHAGLTGSKLSDAFASHGILTADLGNMTGLNGRGYHRITVRNEADNTYLLNVCRELHSDY
jgi:histidinol-phosphate/aromatic aminotransferase/cobyric acid decarboxylase-like protein